MTCDDSLSTGPLRLTFDLALLVVMLEAHFRNTHLSYTPSRSLTSRRSSASVVILSGSDLFHARLCSTRACHPMPTGILLAILQSSSLRGRTSALNSHHWRWPTSQISEPVDPANHHAWRRPILIHFTCSPGDYRRFFGTSLGSLTSNFGGRSSAFACFRRSNPPASFSCGSGPHGKSGFRPRPEFPFGPDSSSSSSS